MDNEICLHLRQRSSCEACEIEQLRRSLSLIRGAQYRMADPKHPNMVFVNRDKWYEAFAPLIAPPYNQLRWEDI